MIELNQVLIPHLRKEEGFKSYAYKDSLGFWTIGIGRLIDGRKGGGISRAEAEYLLKNDIEVRHVALMAKIPWFQSLDYVRQAILMSMAFQMGVDGLMGFKNMLAHVEAGAYLEAARHMMMSKWATQTHARAERMSKAMKTGMAEDLL